MAYVLPQPRREKAAPYAFWKDLFTEEECKKIIELHKEIPGNKAETAGGVQDKKKRVSQVHWIQWEPKHEWIFQKISANVFAGNQQWWGFHLSGLNEPLQLTRYKASVKGHYDWHEDWDSGLFSARKLSGVIPLNHGYKGGEFEFMGNGTPKELTKGSMVLFPSFKTHKVHPVTKGERWSLVFWVTGPPFC